MTRLEEYNERRRLEQERKQRRKRVVKRAAKREGIAPDVIAAKITGKPCRVCGSGYRIELHHIVHRSHWPAKRDGLHHADNAMPVCHECHTNHHTATDRIPLHVLTPDEAAYVVGVKDAQWLQRHYPETIGRTA